MIRKTLRLLGWITACSMLLAAALTTVYLLAGRDLRQAMEGPALDLVDTVREDGETPRRVVGWLDQLADGTLLVRGEVVPAPPPAEGSFCAYGEPVDHAGLQRLANAGYLVGYDNSLPGPRWAAYRVFPHDGLSPPRPSSFRTDRRTTALVRTDEYTRSGYDRGHMAPNYAVSVCHGPGAQAETFLMSNVVPQLHALNAGLWKDLELRIAQRYVERYGEVWVVVGPVFTAASSRRFGRIPVPDAFWAVVSEYDEAGRGVRAVAYLVPHEEKWRDRGLTRYVVSVDRLEEITGLDFFPELSSAAQERLEARPAGRAW
ncbi:MAG: DNA/RNA non-specific endonuclease [Opitutales bacterium]